ncbi:MAG: 2-C-methyl-D-erythritol 4-phosphate cytidylyltransferase, partial [Caulobacteraceae bacterium]
MQRRPSAASPLLKRRCDRGGQLLPARSLRASLQASRLCYVFNTLLRRSATLDKPAATLQKRPMQFAAVIVAAGAGRRAGGETPKQWRPLAGRPVALWSAQALRAAGADPVVVVISKEDAATAAEVFAGLDGVKIVLGGAERIDSVRAGLDALCDRPPQAVLIHDAARPFVTSVHVADLLKALESSEGALPALPVSDTLKRAGADRIVTGTPGRDGLWRAQTPQAFRYAAVVAAYA